MQQIVLSLVTYLLIVQGRFVLSSDPEAPQIPSPGSGTTGDQGTSAGCKCSSPIELDISKTDSTNEFDFSKDEKTNELTFTPKEGFCFNKVVQKKSWYQIGKEKLVYETENEIEYANRVVKVYNKPSKTKTVTAYFVPRSREIHAELPVAKLKFDLNLPSGTRTLEYEFPAVKKSVTYTLPETSNKFTKVEKGDWTLDTDHQKDQEDIIKKFVSEKETELLNGLKNERQSKEAEIKAKLEKIQKDLDDGRAALAAKEAEKKAELARKLEKLEEDMAKDMADLEKKEAEKRAEFEDKLAKFNKELDDLKTGLNRKIENNNALMAEMTKQVKDLVDAQFEKILNDKKAELEKLNRAGADLEKTKEGKDTSLTTTLLDIKSKLENDTAKLDQDIEKRNAEFKRKEAELKVELENLDKEKREVWQKEADLKKVYAYKHAELINEFKRKEAELKSEFDRIKSELEKKEAQLKSELDNKEAELVMAEIHLDVAEHDNETALKALQAEAENQTAKAEKRTKEEKAFVDRAKAEIERKRQDKQAELEDTETLNLMKAELTENVSGILKANEAKFSKEVIEIQTSISNKEAAFTAEYTSSQNEFETEITRKKSNMIQVGEEIKAHLAKEGEDFSASQAAELENIEKEATDAALAVLNQSI